MIPGHHAVAPIAPHRYKERKGEPESEEPPTQHPGAKLPSAPTLVATRPLELMSFGGMTCGPFSGGRRDSSRKASGSMKRA
jgi:hypothetical protein